MNKKITELEEANEINDEDLLMIVQNNQNKKVKFKQLATHTYQVTLTEKVPKNTDYTLPCNYIVGNDSLEIYVLGILFIKDEHYKEVGNPGEISNKIQFLDWDVSAGYTITIKVQGQAGGETNG